MNSKADSNSISIAETAEVLMREHNLQAAAAERATRAPKSPTVFLQEH